MSEKNHPSTKIYRLSVNRARRSVVSPARKDRSSVMGDAFFAPNQGRYQAAFSLIEVLVTLAIMSVALFGLAYVQAQGMQLNTSAYSRTQASILAGDIIDRMRLNAANAADYDTDGFTPDPDNACTVTAAPGADNDRHCWYGRIQQSLPNGDAAIDVDAAGLVTVEITWLERPAGRRDTGFDPSSLSASELDELRLQRVSMSVTL